MSQRLVRRVAVGLIALLLVGCSQSASTASAPAASSSASPAAAATGTSDWDQLVAAARGEGNVVIYGPPGTPYRQMMVDEFQKAYPGIEVNAVFISPADRLSRLSLERQAGQYLADLWISGTTPSVTDVKDDHFSVPLEPQLMLPEVTDTSDWYQGKLWWADSAPPNTVLMFAGDVNPVIYINTSMVDPSQFHSYTDLLDPKWKGKIVSTDIRNPGPGAVPARFMYKSPDLGPAFFTQLYGQMDVTLSNDQQQLINWVGEGAYPIGLFLSQTEVDLGAKQGLPIAAVKPDQLKEGVAMGPANGAVAMIDRAPHPNAAKLYLNWLLSQEGQADWQNIVGDNSLRTDIPKTGLDPLLVPQPGVTYVNAGTEEYSRITADTLTNLINAALPNGGS